MVSATGGGVSDKPRPQRGRVRPAGPVVLTPPPGPGWPALAGPSSLHKLSAGPPLSVFSGRMLSRKLGSTVLSTPLSTLWWVRRGRIVLVHGTDPNARDRGVAIARAGHTAHPART